MNDLMVSGGQPAVDQHLHGFTFLTNYTRVLMLIAKHPDIRMRELATRVGITERAVQRIVDDLTTHNYLLVRKDGRRNQYTVKADLPLRMTSEQNRTVADLIHFLNG